MTSAQFMPSRSTCFISPNIGQSLKKSSLKSYVESDQGSSPFVTEEEAERSLFCVDHFAECSVEEMEELRRKLHTERVTNFVDEKSGVNSVLDTQEEFDHLYLEQDLSLQLQLLQDQIETASNNGSVMSASESDTGKFNSVGNSALMFGLPETVAICMAIMLLTMAPHLIQI